MQPIPVPKVLANAARVLASNALIALFIAMIAGGIGFLFTDWVSTLIVGTADQPRHGLRGQSLLVASTLCQSLLLCVWAGTVGAWAVPAQIYLWVQEEKKQHATLAGAINFGLNRWSRVALPHFLAYTTVALGNIVIVPGIIFGLMFAYVDGIATLDPQEKHVLGRSSRLTSTRRRSIFMIFLTAALGWWLWFQLGLVFLMSTMQPWQKFAVGTVDHMVIIFVELCMVQLYLDMFRKPAVPTAPSSSEIRATAT